MNYYSTCNKLSRNYGKCLRHVKHPFPPSWKGSITNSASAMINLISSLVSVTEDTGAGKAKRQPTMASVTRSDITVEKLEKKVQPVLSHGRHAELLPKY